MAKEIAGKEAGHAVHEEAYTLFIGRWQPFHNGHKWLVDKYLNQGDKVCVMCRDTPITEQNPYSIERRQEMLRRVYGDRVLVVPMPNIKRVVIGRKADYEVVREEPPENIMNISATKVREGANGLVPPEIAVYLDNLKTTFWFTGRPCAGKTTIADALSKVMTNMGHGYSVKRLDGDDIRKRLNKDLGFSEKDRTENLRRIAEVSKLFNDENISVLASFVSPKEEYRRMIKETVGGDNFRLIYVKCSLEEAEKRDTKGMYAKARKGEIRGFTGIDAVFEEPENPDLVVDTECSRVESCIQQIIEKFCI